jgi:hypothetical protein
MARTETALRMVIPRKILSANRLVSEVRSGMSRTLECTRNASRDGCSGNSRGAVFPEANKLGNPLPLTYEIVVTKV